MVLQTWRVFFCICWLVSLLQEAFAYLGACWLFVSGITWVLVYRTDKYKRLKAEVEKQSKKCKYSSDTGENVCSPCYIYPALANVKLRALCSEKILLHFLLRGKWAFFSLGFTGAELYRVPKLVWSRLISALNFPLVGGEAGAEMSCVVPIAPSPPFLEGRTRDQYWNLFLSMGSQCVYMFVDSFRCLK